MKYFLMVCLLLVSVGCSPFMSGLTGLAAGASGSSALYESDLPPESGGVDATDTILGMVEPFVAGIPGVGAIAAMFISGYRRRRQWTALEQDRAKHKAETASMNAGTQPAHVVNVYINGTKVESEVKDESATG